MLRGSFKDVMQWTRPLCNAASTRQNDFAVCEIIL
jgi:hypothetical protein